MQIIVSDTSCVIDLLKAGLLNDLLHLPYTVVIPQPLFDDEILSVTDSYKEELLSLGLEVHEVDGNGVKRASAYYNQHRALQIHDCFALILAEDIDDSILLTGDRNLRTVATNLGIEVHGVLWATDQLEVHSIVSIQQLHEALNTLAQDALVFLPDDEIKTRLRRLRDRL